MPLLAYKLDPIVGDRVRLMSERDREVVADNINAVREDPRANSNHPSFIGRAKPKAWQHTCPHSFVILFRWRGGDETHPPGLVTIEDVIDRY